MASTKASIEDSYANANADASIDDATYDSTAGFDDVSSSSSSDNSDNSDVDDEALLAGEPPPPPKPVAALEKAVIYAALSTWKVFVLAAFAVVFTVWRVEPSAFTYVMLIIYIISKIFDGYALTSYFNPYFTLNYVWCFAVFSSLLLHIVVVIATMAMNAPKIWFATSDDLFPGSDDDTRAILCILSIFLVTYLSMEALAIWTGQGFMLYSFVRAARKLKQL